MDTNLTDLLQQKEDLERKIAQLRRSEKENAIKEIKSIAMRFGLTSNDVAGIFGGGGKDRSTKRVAAKYYDASTGNSWSGRGLKPRWLIAALESGRQLNEFVANRSAQKPEQEHAQEATQDA